MITRIWANGPQQLADQAATMVRVDFMLDGDERVHSIPMIWTDRDAMQQRSRREMGNMFGHMMVNLIHSLNDYVEQTMPDIRRGHVPVPDYDYYDAPEDRTGVEEARQAREWPENE